MDALDKAIIDILRASITLTPREPGKDIKVALTFPCPCGNETYDPHAWFPADLDPDEAARMFRAMWINAHQAMDEHEAEAAAKT
jgi:hypothetical protein